MTKIKATKIRLYPSKEQTLLIEKTFGCCRFIFNHFLDVKIKHYEETKKQFSYFDLTKLLSELRNSDQFPWLKEVSNYSLRGSLRALDNAYKRFFKQKLGFPKFKSKGKSRDSFNVDSNIKVNDDGTVTIPMMGKIPYRGKVNNLVKLRNITIFKDSDGNYYASLCGDYIHEELEKSDKSVGVDLGIKNFAILSDGQVFENNNFLRRKEKKLKFLQRKASKATGNAKLKKKKIVAKQHFKVRCAREQYLHQVSNKIVRENQTIVIENLAVKNMAKNSKLAKSIHDVSWGKFIRMLTYKSEWNGRDLKVIGRFFPSSKTCSNCGTIKEELKLNERTFKCGSCGHEMDRDLNAALNILNEGLNPSGLEARSDVKQKDAERLSLESVMTHCTVKVT